MWKRYCLSLTTLVSCLSQIYLIHSHKEHNYTQSRLGLRRNLLYCAINYVLGVCIVFGDQLLTNPLKLYLLGREVDCAHLYSVCSSTTVKCRNNYRLHLFNNDFLSSHSFFPELGHRTIFLTCFYNCT